MGMPRANAKSGRPQGRRREQDKVEAEPGLGGVAFLQNGRRATGRRRSGGGRAARDPGVHARVAAAAEQRSEMFCEMTPDGSRRRAFSSETRRDEPPA